MLIERVNSLFSVFYKYLHKMDNVVKFKSFKSKSYYVLIIKWWSNKTAELKSTSFNIHIYIHTYISDTKTHKYNILII